VCELWLALVSCSTQVCPDEFNSWSSSCFMNGRCSKLPTNTMHIRVDCDPTLGLECPACIKIGRFQLHNCAISGSCQRRNIQYLSYARTALRGFSYIKVAKTFQFTLWVRGSDSPVCFQKTLPSKEIHNTYMYIGRCKT